MASSKDESPMDVPPAEEKSVENLSGQQSPNATSKASPKKEDLKPPTNSPRRNGIPPKRPLTSNRIIPSGPSSVTKSMTASVTRTTPGNVLSKPPARPMTASTAKRPVASVNAATASSIGHKSRQSTSSMEDTRKPTTGTGMENKRPTVSGAAKRVSLTPMASSKIVDSNVAPPVEKKITPGFSSAGERKPASNQAGGAPSPTRQLTSSTPNSSRPFTVTSSSRTPRLPSSSSRSFPSHSSSQPTRKRLSTIPASPAPASEKVSSISESAARPARPGLSQRKSTMSVTIEQRLREMELVHEMLQAAMAEDGEDDEIKEEYGKKVDETLAELRLKLEEARRNEGKAPIEELETKLDTYEGDSLPVAKEAVEDLNDSQSLKVAESDIALSASQEKISILESELSLIQSKMDHTAEEIRNDHLSKIEALSATHGSEVEALKAQLVTKDSAIKQAAEDFRNEHVSKIDELSATHARELEDLRSQLSEQEIKHKQATTNVNNEHTAEIDGLSATHASELEDLRTEIAKEERKYQQALEKMTNDIEDVRKDEAHQGSKEAERLLDQQRQAHEDAIKVLDEKLREAKNEGVDSSSKVGNLVAEVSKLKGQLEEEKRNSQIHLQKTTADLEQLLQQKDEEIATREKNLTALQSELDEVQNKTHHQLKEAKASHSQRVRELESIHFISQQRVQELEDSAIVISSTHREMINSKDSELSSLGKVIERLQEELQSLHESKERELDANKTKLIQEHERSVSEMQAEHDLAIRDVQDDARKQITASAADKDREIAGLREDIEAARRDSRNVLSQIGEKERLIESLKQEKNEIEEAKSSIEKSRDDAIVEATSLKQVLETFDRDSQDKDEQHSGAMKKLMEELERTSMALEDKNKEVDSVSNQYNIQLERLRESHSKEVEALEKNEYKKSNAALEEREAKYNSLLRSSKQAEQEHLAALEAAKVENEQLLKSAKESHSKEVESLIERLERKYSQDKHDANIKEAERAAEAEKKFLQETSDLQRQHENGLTAAQEEHRKALQELQDQVLQHRKGLADAETELQASRESYSSTERETRTKHDKELSGLKELVSGAKSVAAQLEDELDGLRKEQTRFDATKQQYSAELDELRAVLAKDKATIDELTATMQEANKVLLDSSAVDQCKEEMAALEKKHADEIARFREDMATEAEKRKKERKQGAEVRDRLVVELSELETFRKDLPQAREQAEQHRKAAEEARSQAESAQTKLSHALSTSEGHEKRQKDILAELENVRAELARAKEKDKGHARKESAYNQEVDALQTIADKERDQSDKLKKQLTEVTGKAEHQTTRLREVEAALKVTSAELAEMKTRRADGKEFVTSPPPKGGLRTSRWASDARDDAAEHNAEVPVGEELGSYIEGTVGFPFLNSSSSMPTRGFL